MQMKKIILNTYIASYNSIWFNQQKVRGKEESYASGTYNYSHYNRIKYGKSDDLTVHDMIN